MAMILVDVGWLHRFEASRSNRGKASRGNKGIKREGIRLEHGTSVE